MRNSGAAITLIWKKLKSRSTTAGFEPARAKPKRFLIFLLNHSDKLPVTLDVNDYNVCVGIRVDPITDMPPQDPVHRDPPPGGPSSPPHHSPTQNSPHQENLPPGENHQTPAKPQTSGHNVTHDTPLDPQATSVGNITLC
jgi:hypothetical protein